MHPSKSVLEHTLRFQNQLKGTSLLKRIVDNPNIPNLALESILPTLAQLRVILLSSSTRLSWNDLRESFRAAFTNCLRLPTVTHVELSSIDCFPLSALDHSSSLKRLSLSRDLCYLPPVSPLVYPPLDFLDLYKCSSKSMEIIASWLESRGLHSLRLSRSFERSSRLLEVCANTLTTLIVCVPSDYTNTPNDDQTPILLSLSYLPHLARLTVQTPILITWSNRFSSLPATMQLLNTLPCPPTNLVLLIISVDIKIGNYNALDDISDMDWSPLISFPYFDVIPKVELRVRAQNPGIQISAVKLLGELRRDSRLIQLEMHRSFLINAVEEEPDDDHGSWFHHFGSDRQANFRTTS